VSPATLVASLGAECQLSVCITTRNRREALEQTLASVLGQMPNEGMEVVVVDGVSDDDTPVAMRALAARDPRVRYFRETVNGGIDRDYDKAVAYARGRHCWLMADDDLFLPGAVDRVLAALTNDPALVVVDAEVRDARLAKVLQASRLALPADVVLGPTEHEKLFATTVNHLSFIGGTIIRRSLWLSRDRESYIGTFFIHVGVIFQAPLPGHAVLLANPGIAIRYGVASWSSRSFEIFSVRWPALIWSFTNFSEAVRASVVARDPCLSARYLLALRSTGAYKLAGYRRWLANAPTSAWRKAVQLTIALTPGVLLNPPAIVCLLLLSKNRKLLLVDHLNSPYCLLRLPWRWLQATQPRHSRSPAGHPRFGSDRKDAGAP